MSDLRKREQREISLLLRWGTAVVSITGAFLANRIIPNGIFPAPFYITAVMITAQIGGTGPAVLSFVLSSALLDYFDIPPSGTFAIRPDLFPSLAQFVVPCGLGCWFIQRRKEIELLLRRETMFATRVQGEKSILDIGRSVIDFLAPELGAPIAALYAVEADGSARRCGGYAFDVTEAPETIARDAGVIGQAAREGRTIELSVPPDYLKVRSSLGGHAPSRVVVFPARDGETTRAVLELGLFRNLDSSALHLLRRIGEPLAVAVRGASYRQKLQDLLEETRRQAEELRAHEHELRAANDELEERGRAMLESHRRLDQQQVELEQTNEELQQQTLKVEQQNEELSRAHEAVRIKSDAAERANRAKSEFLANMSHELRTPLNSSLILAKLLGENRDGNLTTEQVRSADTIYSAGNDLLAMIDDILDLAKIEAGRVDVQIEELTLARVRDELLRTFEPFAVERRLRFEVLIPDGTNAALRTDAQRLLQILKNLLSNAFKFTAKGEVVLSITGDGECTRFSVRDTGIGIAQTQLGTIFEPFRQADGTTNRRYGGTGLGLSISRDLARLLGGDIDVKSEPEHGSQFTLTVPKVVPPPDVRTDAPPKLAERRARETNGTPACPSLPSAPASSPDPAARANGRAILVVEDDARFAEIVADLARELHLQPTIAPNAEEAIRLARLHPPKGIVLDMKLPDHSGLSVLDRLKRDPITRHIPVHVISISDHMRVALEMGAVGYMLKPVAREQVKAALETLESQFTRKLRRLLVVEDDLTQQEAICQLLGGDNVEIVAVGSVAEALQQLRSSSFDCAVTDLALPDASGYDLLEIMARDDAYSFPSVIVYTGRSLTAEDEQRLRQYSSSIIVKGARSPERLLDEVTLFLHQVESRLPPERQRMLEKARHREAVFEDRTVLVVEDDVRNVFALTTALEPKGMKVKIARNGREALEALAETPNIDVVLMDVMMPEMDGLEATAAIRRNPKWQKLPILALTAKAMKDDHDRCLEAGANDYLSKPLDVDMLLSLLRVWMPK